MNSESTLAHYLHSAASQRRLMHAWLSDKDFTDKGGMIFYAVDTDIVKLYTDPWGMSVGKGSRKGYAQIFHDENQDLSIALGKALSEFIFHNLSDSENPPIVFSPIEEEIRTVYAAVARDAEKEKDLAFDEFAQQKEFLKGIYKKSDEKDVDKFIKEIPILSQYLVGKRGPTAEFERFNRLLYKRRIVPLRYILKQDWITNKKVRDVFSLIDNAEEWFKTYKLRENWMHMLQDVSSQKDEENIKTDAKALARLEWINMNLVQRKS